MLQRLTLDSNNTACAKNIKHLVHDRLGVNKLVLKVAS
jgi:hypothetical protein